VSLRSTIQEDFVILSGAYSAKSKDLRLFLLWFLPLLLSLLLPLLLRLLLSLLLGTPSLQAWPSISRRRGRGFSPGVAWQFPYTQQQMGKEAAKLV
jgi:hypothetical protein